MDLAIDLDVYIRDEENAFFFSDAVRGCLGKVAEYIAVKRCHTVECVKVRRSSCTQSSQGSAVFG